MFKSSRAVLLEHLAHVRSVSTPRKKVDQQNLSLLERDLNKFSKRYKFLSRFRVVVFILLYASLVSAFSSNLPVLGDVAQTIAVITGILGASILSVLLVFLTFRMNQVWNKMLIIYSHAIAIYEKNNTHVYRPEEVPEVNQKT